MSERIFICDAYDAGFEIEPTTLNIKSIEENDLRLTRFSKNYEEIDKATLFAVNGLVYPSVVKEDGIYLINANVPDGQRVILIRTNQIGEITKHKIKSEQVTNPNNIDPSIEHAIYLKTDFNLFNNFYMLIIAGFLFVKDDRLEIIDTNTLMIKQLSLDLDKKFLLANSLFNSDELNDLILNKTTLERDKFFNFKLLQSVISNDNSFIVSFNKKLKCSKKQLGSHYLPGKYRTVDNKNGLLISRFGKVLDYKIGGNKWHSLIEGNYLINNLSRNFTVKKSQLTTIVNDLPYQSRYEDIVSVNISL